MTPTDLTREWRYRYDEALANLIGSAEPTRAQIDYAAGVADEWENAWKIDNAPLVEASASRRVTAPIPT